MWPMGMWPPLEWPTAEWPFCVILSDDAGCILDYETNLIGVSWHTPNLISNPLFNTALKSQFNCSIDLVSGPQYLTGLLSQYIIKPNLIQTALFDAPLNPVFNFLTALENNINYEINILSRIDEITDIENINVLTTDLKGVYYIETAICGCCGSSSCRC